MSKWFKTTIISLCTAMLVVFFGCSLAMDAVSPCPIDPKAAEYSGQPLKKQPLPFTTVWDAKRIDSHLDYRHKLNQIALVRTMEDDNSEYGFLKDAHMSNLQAGAEFQQVVFSPSGALGALIPGLSCLGIGAYCIKRPQEKELEKKLNGNNVAV